MKNFITHDPWKIVEKKFQPEVNLNSESLLSIGNGRMGQRANFEEKYSGPSLQGSYIAGIYYPDKTRVGWWKNGYPEYFAKVLNSVNWIGVRLMINQKEVDLAKVKIDHFERSLDMQNGILSKTVILRLSGKRKLELTSHRFYSLADKDCCALQYQLRLLNFSAEVRLVSYLDFNVSNSDANYNEDFWSNRSQAWNGKLGHVKAQTRKTNFHVAACMRNIVTYQTKKPVKGLRSSKQGQVQEEFTIKAKKGQNLTLNKYVSISSSLYHKKKKVEGRARSSTKKSARTGFKSMKSDQVEKWREIWDKCDVVIEGDLAAQQGIRFNIFQLLQTYMGDDPRLNIGPKGFTGEKYGGSTYWDTEAYCLPFYLSTSEQSIAKNLLIYRHRHLKKAIENAMKLGFDKGAALYPMVTMNGEECHNEWEITFEEIHRNGAIAYAIYDYIRYTGDREYLCTFGLEVLIAISRFWAQRVHVSPVKKQYVIHGVTGPNEYENNVNNNWYTNYIATWCLRYTLESLQWVQNHHSEAYAQIVNKTGLNSNLEFPHWEEIIEEMFYPKSASTGIFWQQDGYEDKENATVDALADEDRPLNQKWSWDRILRSPYIKQADVLQGLYFFEDEFQDEEIRRNFEYYEPRTVHESSLSPCIHAILAAKIGMREKAYEMYLRTARLDLDDYNNDTEDGCHITSMAGTWLSLTKGFGGMRVINDQLHFHPFLPDSWDKFSFRIGFRGQWLEVGVNKEEISVRNMSSQPLSLSVYDQSFDVGPESFILTPIRNN